MEIVDLFSNYFWEVATASVPLVVPVIAIVLLFKILSLLILKAGD